MRQQCYSHPQLSSGYACRDKRWSGLIPSNKIESHHLLSSAAFGSAQWERPHLGRLKDTYTVTTSRCVSRALGREIEHFCVRQAQAMCLRLWKGLCDAGARESTEPCLPKERSSPHPTNTHPGLGPWLQTQAGNTGLDRSGDAATSRRQRRICYKSRIYDSHLY